MHRKCPQHAMYRELKCTAVSPVNECFLYTVHQCVHTYVRTHIRTYVHTACRHQTHVSEDGNEVSVEVHSLVEGKQNGFIDPGSKKGVAGEGQGREVEGRRKKGGTLAHNHTRRMKW